MKNAEFSFGEGKYMISARAFCLGNDVSAIITGGTLPHVGAVALAQYEPVRDSATVSTITAFTHRDDFAASFFAKEISRGFKCNASATAGIHIDDASVDELNELKNNILKCCEGLISEMRD